MPHIDNLLVQEKKRKVCGHRDPLRETEGYSDLLRLTRLVLQVAELLPWPDKDRLFQIQITPSEARDCGNQVFWREQP
jgi:hypothetical protein